MRKKGAASQFSKPIQRYHAPMLGGLLGVVRVAAEAEASDREREAAAWLTWREEDVLSVP